MTSIRDIKKALDCFDLKIEDFNNLSKTKLEGLKKRRISLTNIPLIRQNKEWNKEDIEKSYKILESFLEKKICSECQVIISEKNKELTECFLCLFIKSNFAKKENKRILTINKEFNGELLNYLLDYMTINNIKLKDITINIRRIENRYYLDWRHEVENKDDLRNGLIKKLNKYLDDLEKPTDEWNFKITGSYINYYESKRKPDWESDWE